VLQQPDAFATIHLVLRVWIAAFAVLGAAGFADNFLTTLDSGVSPASRLEVEKLLTKSLYEELSGSKAGEEPIGRFKGIADAIGERDPF
jgi:hypothetical protein